jgi:uncharacterized protein (DUF488 family)
MDIVSTIGHSTCPVEEFIGILHARGVQLVVDVQHFGRATTLQFNSEGLKQA